VLRRRNRLWAGIFLIGPVALGVLLPAAAAQRRDRASALRATQSRLAREQEGALLELYSLETQLARARARVAALDRQQAALEALGLQLHGDIASVTHSMDDAQSELQQQVRALYEQPSPDPIAVVLGAQSLDEAISSLDNLRRVARQSSNLVNETSATRERLSQLLARLDVQQRHLATLRASAGAEAARLDLATASRRAFVAALERKKELNAGALAALEHRARAAARKSVAQTGATTLVAASPATTTTTSSADTAPAPPPANPTAPGLTMTVVATAYALPGHTSTGLPVGHGIAAVDPSVIPLGTRFEVPGYGTAVAADVGSGIRGAEIDLWFPTDKAARDWGRRTVTVTFK
jgi:3D (Asp-Asp-Asp) domain-containing protein/septal ring factor EnvC (AmiA/AmiB activator)